ncbi:MAG: RNA methyltransferase [Actinomycetia bacterium]|nr:RNA methyltransferase [Actinomycetes bacterium]
MSDGPLAASNARIRTLRRLTGRRKERLEAGCFVVDGPVLVAEALASALTVREVYAGHSCDEPVLAAAAGSGVPIIRVVDGVLTRVLDPVTAQEVAALVELPTPLTVADLARSSGQQAPFVLVLAEIQDPGNTGTLLRTAEAVGVDLVIGTEGTADAFAPKTVRASAGAVLRLPVIEGVTLQASLAELGALGLHRLAARVKGARPHTDVDLTVPVALVLGNEARGLPSEADQWVDEGITIPLSGPTESLNVAAAGAVLCFEARRQRDQRPTKGA